MKLPIPFSFSQSSLQDYTDCPRRFQLRYVDKLEWPAIDSEPIVENERRQIEGQLFHRLVHQYFLGIPPDILSPTANTPNLERWWRNFKSTLTGPGDLSGFDLYPELTLSAPIGNHRLAAKYDLVAVHEENGLIYDWKTYAKRPRDEWMSARWQTRVYRSLLVLAGNRLHAGKSFDPAQIEMIYWYADFPSEPVHLKYSTDQFNRDWSAIEKVVEEISGGEDFPLTEDEKLCRFCIYRSYCNRGAQAGQAGELEMEMDSEASFDVNFEQISEIEF